MDIYYERRKKLFKKETKMEMNFKQTGNVQKTTRKFKTQNLKKT